MVLVLAAMNAFYEEVSYRASFLATLERPLGSGSAVMLAAVYSGLAHYGGVLGSVPGVLMSGFLGWLLGKSMVETRGFLWAWSIHFLQDIVVFSFMAIGSVTAGGRGVRRPCPRLALGHKTPRGARRGSSHGPGTKRARPGDDRERRIVFV